MNVMKYEIPSLHFTTIIIPSNMHSKMFGFVVVFFCSLNRIILWPCINNQYYYEWQYPHIFCLGKTQPQYCHHFQFISCCCCCFYCFDCLFVCVCQRIDNNHKRRTQLFVFFDHIILVMILCVCGMCAKMCGGRMEKPELRVQWEMMNNKAINTFSRKKEKQINTYV